MAENNSREKVADLSIQSRSESNDIGNTLVTSTWFRSNVYDLVAPWWSPQRDYDLRDFVKLEGNDILAGAVSSLVKKFTAMNWKMTGPRGNGPGSVEWHQPVLADAEFGQGWKTLISKTIEDYLTQDKGAFWELIGLGDPLGPIQSPGVLGIAHLDSEYCQLTGDLEYPVIFYSSSDGKPRKLHWSRVIHFVDMPSPNEDMCNVGFCGVSRTISSSKVLLKVLRYKDEKLTDLPEAGLLIFNNVLPQKWEDAKMEFSNERRRLGQELWVNIMTFFGLDPSNPASADFINFSSLPDAFNEKETIDIYINIVALAFGVDVREFWPMSVGPLGTAAEALVQHQKAKGKAVGDIIGMLEKAINQKILPESIHFQFDFKDDEEDKLKAEINQLKTDTIMSMFIPATEFQDSPISIQEIRQMLADNVEYFKEDFLQVDTTEDVTVTDTERVGEKLYTLDSKGNFGVVEQKKSTNLNRLLSMVEKNYRAGKVSLDDVIDFRIGEILENRLI